MHHFAHAHTLLRTLKSKGTYENITLHTIFQTIVFLNSYILPLIGMRDLVGSPPLPPRGQGVPRHRGRGS